MAVSAGRSSAKHMWLLQPDDERTSGYPSRSWFICNFVQMSAKYEFKTRLNKSLNLFSWLYLFCLLSFSVWSYPAQGHINTALGAGRGNHRVRTTRGSSLCDASSYLLALSSTISLSVRIYSTVQQGLLIPETIDLLSVDFHHLKSK